MTSWQSNYVTDVAYIPGYYPQQSPAHMVTAARLVGVACDMPDPDEPVHFLELGCGLGFTALTLAASNPTWRVTAVDFNPAHIATARAFARQAGIDNAVFIEADLGTLAEERAAEAIPEADFVSVHGLWSWVPATVQSGVVRLLRAKVRAGGVVHLSYNTLPAWQGGIGMQRLVRAAGLARPGSSDRQVEAGFALLRELHAAGARQLACNGIVEGILERLAELPREYLAHEYMNASWSPCFHADVAEALSAAKLDWVASANLLENFTELTLTEAQRKVYDTIEDPLTRELIKDLCQTRMLRHDVFVRGPHRLASADKAAALHEIVLTLTVAPEDFVYEIDAAAGKAALSREIYAPVAAALADGPRPLGDLLSLPALAGKRDNPGEIAGFLIGTGQAIPLLRPGAEQSDAAVAFNQLLAQAFGRMDKRGTMLALASTALGAGLPASAFDLFVHERVQAGEDESALDGWTTTLGAGLTVDQHAKLREHLARILARRAPAFRHAGTFRS